MDITAVLLVIIIVILLYMLFCVKMNKRVQKAENISQQIEKSVEETTNIEEKCTKNTSKTNSSHIRKTSKMKWHNRMLDISMIPKTVELDRTTLLPKSIKRQYEYGRRFNAFVSRDEDFYYHRSTCHNIKTKPHDVIHRYIALQEKFPCPECTPNALIDDWYIEFLKVNFDVDISSDDNSYKNFNLKLWLSNTALPEHEYRELLK